MDLRPEIVDSELTSIPVTLVDTAGTDLWETVGDDSVSKGNEGEAQIVKVSMTATDLWETVWDNSLSKGNKGEDHGGYL